MKLPAFNYGTNKIRAVQKIFRGLERQPGAGDGSIGQMVNMSGELYPLTSPRNKRSVVYELEECQGVIAPEDKLCYAADYEFFMDGRYVGPVSGDDKTFAVMGKRLLIFPDKRYLNFSAMGCYDTLAQLRAAVTDAEEGDTYAVGYTDPYSLYRWDGDDWQYWEREFGTMEPSVSGTVIFKHNGSIFGEAAVNNTIYKSGTNWSSYFKVGDAVEIKGCTAEPQNNGIFIVREISGNDLRFYENSFILTADLTETGVSIRRSVPALEDVCTVNNRLWGIKEGTIYCSKLGDPFNFNVFDGLYSDSYRWDSGSGGDFTACCSLLGYPTFFKGHEVIRVHGSDPSSFTTVVNPIRGIPGGNGCTLQVLDDTAYYLSYEGIMSYSGSVSRYISKGLGSKRLVPFDSGIAGKNYYLSCFEPEDNITSLYVYDTENGFWHREDNPDFEFFFNWKNALCALDDTVSAWTVAGNYEGTPLTTEADVSWSLELNDITGGIPDMKTVQKLMVRLEAPAGGEVWFDIAYDGGAYENVCHYEPTSKGSVTIPLIPRRCDHFKLRIRGKNKVFLHMLTLYY